MRWLLIVALFLAGPSTAFSQSAPPPPRLYAVIFEVTVDSSGKLASLVVSKVIDPQSGSTGAVAVKVPEEYIAAARGFLRQRTYPPETPHFFTYTYYDPARPGKADIDPKTGLP